ncbi:MAG: flagellar biosynthetic protein FliP [Alphaproteobacteria bacterium CG11_big_fil_rev_8_21_14_0_20_39_49]|nr:MAG: flagellar biosynthetic protein FliP [Alphaproteobacteria bacterium CG11_big_fil_rev_8_21_14_0_20_39_49]
MRIFLLFTLLTVLGDNAFAQTLSLDMGEGGGQVTSRILQLIAVITVISLAPSILVMVTSFTRIVVVFSFLRTALGLQQTPPNSVIISLSLFLTMFIMQPVFMESYNKGLKPLMDEEITEEEAIEPTIAPFKVFMLQNVREKDLGLFFELSDTKVPEKIEDTSLRILIPAFMISELRRAFEIGFLLFIPFLIIDLMVASTLMAMGMMMLPPVLISLPFKLIFFVLIDGWYMVVGSLVKSFGG